MSALGKRVCVGAVAGAHGVRGAVKIKSFTGTPEDKASKMVSGELSNREARIATSVSASTARSASTSTWGT